jgi:hypothetical protein
MCNDPDPLWMQSNILPSHTDVHIIISVPYSCNTVLDLNMILFNFYIF